MTFRAVVSRELGRLLGVLAHPVRLRLVEELRSGERDVKTLSEALGLAHSSVSRHVGVLRVHHVAVERRSVDAQAALARGAPRTRHRGARS